MAPSFREAPNFRIGPATIEARTAFTDHDRNSEEIVRLLLSANNTADRPTVQDHGHTRSGSASEPRPHTQNVSSFEKNSQKLMS